MFIDFFETCSNFIVKLEQIQEMNRARRYLQGLGLAFGARLRRRNFQRLGPAAVGYYPQSPHFNLPKTAMICPFQVNKFAAELGTVRSFILVDQ
jgi:hypothetical protein